MNVTTRQNLAWVLAAVCSLGAVVLGFVAWYAHESARLAISVVQHFPDLAPFVVA